MQRQNLFADAPWDVEDVDSRRRIFWRPDDARMGATLYELAPGYDGDRVHMHYGAEGLHAFSNPHDEPARLLAMSAGGYPDVVAYPEHDYAWVATRVPELPAGDDPGIIARFEFDMDRPDDRVS